jgi:hypothetical protein
VPPKNLEELARALRVSRRTVSRVLARSPNVAAKERARIEKYLARVQYVPNMAAAHLAAGRTNVLGLVLPTSISQSIDDYVLRLIKGVFLTAEARRHRLMFFSFTPLQEDALRALFKSRTVGGLLFSFVGEPEFGRGVSARSAGTGLGTRRRLLRAGTGARASCPGGCPKGVPGTVWVPAGVEVYAKAEFMNPGGSVKDRAAKNMMLEALKRPGNSPKTKSCWTPLRATPASPTP